VVGSLANNPPQENQIVHGVLVQKDFNMSLIAPEDLHEFAGLDTNVVMQRQVLAFHGGLPLLKWHLDQMFGGVIVESGRNGKNPMFKVLKTFFWAKRRLWTPLWLYLNLIINYPLIGLAML
jgi:cleavage and polyadenylation specificity factor subunit 3